MLSFHAKLKMKDDQLYTVHLAYILGLCNNALIMCVAFIYIHLGSKFVEHNFNKMSGQVTEVVDLFWNNSGFIT